MTVLRLIRDLDGRFLPFQKRQHRRSDSRFRNTTCKKCSRTIHVSLFL
uniref:Uncharacterized protein n=1 Tax=Lepeophtheirus salmonis TaxID=72036 RepID=A0A0K2UT15_LEPSM